MKNQFSEIAIAVLLSLTMVSRLDAQPLQPEVLASFKGTNGVSPAAGLTEGRDGNFYGTTPWGGTNDAINGGDGTVFRVTTNGLLTMLVSFSGTNGAHPYAGLALGNDGNFYGTTVHGGSFNDGTLFRVTTNGDLTTLVSFGGTNGAEPNALTLGNDGNFYGTTWVGGSGDIGTVFRLTTNGVLTTLVSFADTNGGWPNADLTLGNDGNFYGTTEAGGSGGVGTVFRLTTNGVFTTLAAIAGIGAYADAPLTLGNDGNFYSTTEGGGEFTNQYSYGWGTVFRVTTNGVLTRLVSFADTNGANPHAGLVLGTDGNFYGTTYYGGAYRNQNNYTLGTVFQVTTNGVLTTLLSFAGTNGANPYASLCLGSDGNFYGTTAAGGTGGAYDSGIIFRLRRGVSIQSFEKKANGFELNTLNVGGSGWVVLESSSDLTHWTPIQTNGTAAAQQFLDTTASTQPRQFYRVRQQ